MKNFIKKLTGQDKVEAKLAEDVAQVEAERWNFLNNVILKTITHAKKEPWVNVIDVKVNEENVRNGFFELDWNKYFIAQLVEAGYGVDNDPEEEIVDRWFRDIVYNMLEEEGGDTTRAAGHINVVPISKGRSEVS